MFVAVMFEHLLGTYLNRFIQTKNITKHYKLYYCTYFLQWYIYLVFNNATSTKSHKQWTSRSTFSREACHKALGKVLKGRPQLPPSLFPNQPSPNSSLSIQHYTITTSKTNYNISMIQATKNTFETNLYFSYTLITILIHYKWNSRYTKTI